MGCVKLNIDIGKKYIQKFNHLEAVRKYKLKNKDKISEYHRKYYQNHKAI